MKQSKNSREGKKSERLRNIAAFVRAYLGGKNGQEALRRHNPFAIAFAKAVA